MNTDIITAVQILFIVWWGLSMGISIAVMFFDRRK